MPKSRRVILCPLVVILKGVTWHTDSKSTIRGSVGKGFRMPSLFELYKVHVRHGGAYYREVNPSFKPENIFSWDFGAERNLS